jgi:hypothetical protein
MARSSILGGETAPARAPGNDVDALGPSSSSDSGSDVQGARGMVGDVESDSDAGGTGERSSVEGNTGRANSDVMPDRIVTPGRGGVSEDALGDVDDMVGEDEASVDESIDGREEDADDDEAS